MKHIPLRTPRAPTVRGLTEHVARAHRRVVKLSTQLEKVRRQLMRARVRLSVLKQLASENAKGRLGGEV